MSRLIMILLVLGAIMFWWHWISAPDTTEKKRLMQRAGFGVLLAVILLLVITGRMHWIGAVLAALLAVVRQNLPILIQYFPAIGRWYKDRTSSGTSGSSQTAAGPDMSVEEALQILGLSGNPTKEEITRAYRKVMQQLHPDRGGNAYFAAKVNKARDVLNTRFG